ncbi:hypothetical protein J2Z76_002949 [Sedimentibacter acidaminivorans]|jgi:hypothetical protein|uniref:Uncharacterized protein n=1 Tax=Sedimentibacter acidaminivorans TaxID=913099 RepID=A0ABS4GHB8_9FIRM|nr:hypothetical protein [Sedimentibacter acidaminivorans]MBP1927076.1 hypothetical protein [Sedimentibacter acidaminivorans]
MKITITNECGDFKEMLYTKDKVTYEVKSQEIVDFFSKLSEAYINNYNMDEMYECLYNLINYGYLYTDIDYEESSNYDSYDDFDDYLYDDLDYDYIAPAEGIKLIDSEIEYFINNEQVTKEEYNNAWDEKLGYLGSSNWEEKGLCITNTDTEEILFLGKIS